METIIAALVSAASAVLVCVISNRSQQNKTRALLEYKLDELSKRVDKHNQVIERVYRLEQHTAVTDEQIKVANHRISDLETQHKG